LGWRHVDVVRSGQIVVVGRAEEAVAVGENLKDSLGEDVAFFFALSLEDLEDQILLAEAAGARNLKRTGNAAQLCNVFFFEFCDGHVHLRKGGMFGGGLEGEVLRRKRPDGSSEIQPARTSFQSSPQLIWSSGAPGKR
jgi:hypothetical protein